MNDFYVIIGIAPNPATKDHLSVGMIVFSGETFRYQIAWQRIKDIRPLLKTSRSNLEWMLKQITETLEGINTKVQQATQEMFPYAPSIRSDFFQYLERYNNGLIRFSDPKPLTRPLQGADFDKMFGLLISEQDIARIPPLNSKQLAKLHFEEKIESKLIHRLKDNVHTRFKVTEKHIPQIFFSLELDCVGKNGVIYAAKSFDFENTSAPTLGTHLMQYGWLHNAWDVTFRPDKGRNQYFLIADEPREIRSEAHKQWVAASKADWIQMVASEEAERISTTILEAKASRFL